MLHGKPVSVYRVCGKAAKESTAIPSVAVGFLRLYHGSGDCAVAEKKNFSLVEVPIIIVYWLPVANPSNAPGTPE